MKSWLFTPRGALVYFGTAFLVALLVMWLLLLFTPAQACEIAFDCAHHSASINGKHYPIICGRQTGRELSSGAIGHLIHASGPWRPGLVAPGTPMITTVPRLCFDCFIHVSGLRYSNGCLGTTSAAFQALKSCGGSRFSIQK